MDPESEKGGGAAIVARPAEGRFATLIDLPGGALLADEPPAVGGGGAGPTPYQLLSAALAACTSMTLGLYGRRNGLVLPGLRVEVEHALIPGTPPTDRFTRRIVTDSPLAPADEAKMIDIAGKCPVHRTLSGGGAEIVTRAAAIPPPAPALKPADPPHAHVEQMEKACAEAMDAPAPAS
jgi:putative redox protein